MPTHSRYSELSGREKMGMTSQAINRVKIAKCLLPLAKQIQGFPPLPPLKKQELDEHFFPAWVWVSYKFTNTASYCAVPHLEKYLNCKLYHEGIDHLHIYFIRN